MEIVVEDADDVGSGQDDRQFEGELRGVGAVWQLALADSRAGFGGKQVTPLLLPVYAHGRITLQPIRAAQPAFNAALVGYLEATRHNDAEKNLLCPPNPYPDTATDWITATSISQRALTTWLSDPDLSAWMEGARLNAARGIGDHLTDPRMKSALARSFANAEPALTKLETFQAQAAHRSVA